MWDHMLEHQDALNNLHVKLVHDLLMNGANIEAVTLQVELVRMPLCPCLCA